MKAVKTYTIYFFIALCLISCAKREAPGTPEDVVIGTWKLMQTATDDNKNLILDDQELRTLDTADKDTYIFYRDYSGQENLKYYGTISDYALTWKLIEGSRYMQIIKLGRDTTNYTVVKFAASNLTLLDTSGITYSWYIFKKQ